MIRIYLDWNVFSGLKNPRTEDLKELKELIQENKNRLQFIYSSTHFEDLIKSYTPDNKYFNEDLENLDYLTEGHRITHDGKNTKPYLHLPSDYFESLKTHGITFYQIKANLNNLFERLGEMAKEEGLSNIFELGKIPLKLQQTPINVDDFGNYESSKLLFAGLNNNDSLWDSCTKLFDNFGKFMFDSNFYKQVRGAIQKENKVNLNSSIKEPNQIFEKVDELMLESPTENRKKLKDVIIELIKNQDNPTDFKIFTSVYLTLDLMGVRSDNLKDRNNTPLNIINDAAHAYYGGYCDYFVASDKKLLFRAKGIYEEFGIGTKALNVRELVDELKSVIHKPNNLKSFVDECFSVLKEEYSYEDELSKTLKNTLVFKFPFFLLNYFNVGILSFDEKQGMVLQFRRVFQNLSRFVYYTEDIKLLERVFELFDYQPDEKEVDDFVYGRSENKAYSFQIYSHSYFRVEREIEEQRLTVVFLLSSKNIQKWDDFIKQVCQR